MIEGFDDFCLVVIVSINEFIEQGIVFKIRIYVLFVERDNGVGCIVYDQDFIFVVLGVVVNGDEGRSWIFVKFFQQIGNEWNGICKVSLEEGYNFFICI